MTPMQRTRIVAAAIGAALAIAGATAAQRVKKSKAVSRPNLVAAQRFSQQAWDRVAAAQRANEWDAEGHAQKAKDLLAQANVELRLAAEATDKSGK